MVIKKLYLVICFFLLWTSRTPAQTGTITTVAGGLPQKVNPLSVALGSPTFAIDSAGNTYVADKFNNVIYKVAFAPDFETNPTGLTTIAGTGGAGGFSGDGGPASQAQFSGLSDIALDSHGNIFVADSNNCRVREIVIKTGIIQTVAGTGTGAEFGTNGCGYSGDGGSATNAQLNGPGAVFVDGEDNLFISDSGNNVVREVVALTGSIHTVAGNFNFGRGYSGDGGLATDAQLSSPAGIAVDSLGNIFIADTENSVIRVVLASTKKIQTFAGNGTFGFSGDFGPAANAQLNSPEGVTVASFGILIADTGNGRIRVISNSGQSCTAPSSPCDISTLVDGSGVGLFQPTRVSTEASAISDKGNSLIFEVRQGAFLQSFVGSSSQSGELVSATSTLLHRPTSVFEDAAGDIFIAEEGNSLASGATDNRIREVLADKLQTVAGGATVAGGSCGGHGPGGSCNFLGDGGPATLAVLSRPFGVFVDGKGNIFIADSGNNLIREVSGGVIQAVAGSENDTDGNILNFPACVFVDQDGNIFICNTFHSVLNEVVKTTGLMKIAAGGGNPADEVGDGGPATQARVHPNGVFVDVDGNIFIADSSGRIRKVTKTTGIIETVAGNGNNNDELSGDGGSASAASIGHPTAVFVDSAGNIFIASGSSVIRKVDASTGIIQTVVGNGTVGFSGDGGPATSAELNDSLSIWGDAQGNLLIADLGNGRIRRVEGITSVPASTLSSIGTFTGALPTQTATLSNSGTAPLLISSIAIGGTNSSDFVFESATTCPITGGTLKAGASCTVAIGLPPSVVADASAHGTVTGSATLTIIHNSANGTPTPAFKDLSGQFQQDAPLVLNYAAPVLSFSPASLAFTTVNVPQTITLQNNGSTPLSITSLTPSAGFTVASATSNGCTSTTPSPAAPLTLSGNTGCDLSITFTGSGTSSNGILTIVDNAFSLNGGSQSVALSGYALITTSGQTLTLSNSAASPSATANLEILGPSTATYNLLCVVAPAGLAITCPTTPVNAGTPFNAVISIPSCAIVTPPLRGHRETSRPPYALLAFMVALLFLIYCNRAAGKRGYVTLASGLLCAATFLSSCGGGITSSAGCVATVTVQTYTATVTAIPANTSSVPTVTTVPPITITVTH